MVPKIFANGFPKSGNHALVKALELLGLPAAVNHNRHADGAPEGHTHHVLIVRDPRNVALSQMRWMGQAVAPGTYLATFRGFNGTTSLIDEMSAFEDWLIERHVIKVRYEDLVVDDQTMRFIAQQVGVDYIDGAFEELEGHTSTWNALKSDYRSLWTSQVSTVWEGEGGRELVERWGYVWNS